MDPPSETRSRKSGPWTIVLAALALFLTMAGGATAADKLNRDEVTTFQATGSLLNNATHDQEVSFNITPSTFTQQPGEVVLITGTAVVTRSSFDCDVYVTVLDENAPEQVGFEMRNLWERGDAGDRTDSEAIPAPASATTRALGGRAFNAVDEGSCESTGTYSVSVRVSVVTYRD